MYENRTVTKSKGEFVLSPKICSGYHVLIQFILYLVVLILITSTVVIFSFLPMVRVLWQPDSKYWSIDIL